MSSRGPDAEGVWAGEGVVLGHRRLAIIDLDPRSNQPMLSADGRYCLVFNGEIYNFRELKHDLEAQGDVFRTTSDSEVLIALYARYRETMLPRLRGMFAFAIWDTQSKEIFLARDPYGIKPLYYTVNREGLIFASQVKALLSSGLVPNERETAGIAGFYLWGNVPEPWTFFRGVLALPPGSFIVYRDGLRPTPQGWNDVSVAWNQEQIRCSMEEVQSRVAAAVTDSVRAHQVADVPISVFLSGGIDSGSIAGLLSQLGAKVEGITIEFGEFAELDEDEVPVARKLAQHYGLEHHVRLVTRQEFEADMGAFLNAMDQPTVDGVNTWLASKAAAERGYKVVLSGVGGDELFYGYSLVREIPRTNRRNRILARIPGAPMLLRKVIGAFPPGRLHPKLKGAPDFMGSLEGEYLLRRGLFLPGELPELMGRDEAKEGLQRLGGWLAGIPKAEAVNSEGAVCMLDSTLYLRNQLLRDSDWASMAHSLELRTPLVDARLLDALKGLHAHFNHGAGKRLLARSPADPLPDEIVNRRKTGFVVPMTQWLSQFAESVPRNRFSAAAGPGTPWTRRWSAVVMEAYSSAGVAGVSRRSA
jgi:asparagine synthase (glutamine-hydrolysing)